MNTDDLRNGLTSEAAIEPMPSPDLRARVARDVRRRRILGVCAGIPFVVGVVAAGALVAGRGPQDATVAAAGNGGSVVPVPGTGKATTPPLSTPADPSAPASSSTTPAPTPTNGDCRTITIGADMKPPADLGPAQCMVAAVNTNTAATLHVNVSSPDAGAGSIALTVTTSTEHTVTIASSGSMTITLPKELSSIVGMLGGKDAATGPVTCPDTTMDVGKMADKMAAHAEAKNGGGATAGADDDDGGPAGMLGDGFMCPMRALSHGGTWNVILIDGRGGSITNAVSFSTDQKITVTTSGSITMVLPKDLHIPEDLIAKISKAGVGGMGSIGGMGGGWPGAGGKGHGLPGSASGATTTTVAGN